MVGAESDGEDRDLETAREDVLGSLVGFVRALRRRGVRIPADGSVAAARALATVGLADRERVRAAVRASLVSREADLETFEGLFPEFWRHLRWESDPFAAVAPERGDRTPAPSDGIGAETPAEGWRAGHDPSRSDGVKESDVGSEPNDTSVERETAFATSGDDAMAPSDDGEFAPSTYSPSGTPEPVTAAAPRDRAAGLEESVRRLGDALATVRDRRFDRSKGDRADVRRALRESVATGGTVVSMPTRNRRRSAVRAVVLVDVSRSVLETIDRAFLLEFLGALTREWRSLRLFFFDTDLREVTDAFDRSTVEAPRTALERAETEWGGGTRIGRSLQRLRREHPDAVDRRTAVLVVSDGLEVGEIDALEDGMAWLGRRASALLWLNPLAAADEYEPTCRGMARSLPYLDGLFAFAGPDDLAALADRLERREVAGAGGAARRSSWGWSADDARAETDR